MQIDAIGTPTVTTAGKSESTAAKATASPSPVTDSAAQAPLLSGGLRTISLGLLEEAEAETKARATDFAEIVAQKTTELAGILMDSFKAADISTDKPMVLVLDSIGAITTDGPNKEIVKKYFEDHPDLTKQLKDVMALNTILALNMAMRHFHEQKEAAKTDEQHKHAEADYVADTAAIYSLGNTMALEDSQLTSAALQYITKRYGQE